MCSEPAVQPRAPSPSPSKSSCRRDNITVTRICYPVALGSSWLSASERAARGRAEQGVGDSDSAVMRACNLVAPIFASFGLDESEERLGMRHALIINNWSNKLWHNLQLVKLVRLRASKH